MNVKEDDAKLRDAMKEAVWLIFRASYTGGPAGEGARDWGMRRKAFLDEWKISTRWGWGVRAE